MEPFKNITVQYFAMFRETAGKDREEITTSADTARACYMELAERYGFNIGAGHIRVAINDEFGRLDQQLCSGDTLVFIPPVSGG